MTQPVLHLDTIKNATSETPKAQLLTTQLYNEMMAALPNLIND